MHIAVVLLMAFSQALVVVVVITTVAPKRAPLDKICLPFKKDVPIPGRIHLVITIVKIALLVVDIIVVYMVLEFVLWLKRETTAVFLQVRVCGVDIQSGAIIFLHSILWFRSVHTIRSAK